MAETISLLNMKGGVGKTTLAANLAWHAYRQGGHKVLLIDFDPQFNASQYLLDFEDYKTHVRANGTIATLLIDSPSLHLERRRKKKKTAAQCIVRIEDSLASAEGCLDILPSQLELAYVVKNPAQMEHRLELILQGLRGSYDYIFIDCAPTDSILTTMALTSSNFILTPMRPDRYSLLGFGNLIETIGSFREKSLDPNNVRELGIVFTQVRNSPIEESCMQGIHQLAGEKDYYVFDGKLGFSNTFIRALEEQTPAFQTRFAREDLKSNMDSIVEEMENRIAKLREEDE